MSDHPLSFADVFSLFNEQLKSTSSTDHMATPAEELQARILNTARAVYDLGIAHSTGTNDGWEPLDQKDLDTIQKGDEVERTYVSTDKSLLLVSGIADHQDSDGDWMTSGGRFLTVNENSYRTYRIRRAARPELPTVRPATIADVTINGLTCSRMDLTVYNKWVGVDQYGRIQLWTSSEVSTADWRPYRDEVEEDQ